MSNIGRIVLRCRSLASTRRTLGRHRAGCVSWTELNDDQQSTLCNERFYSNSARLLEETTQSARKRANDFVVRRAAYKREVSKLRKAYAAEVAAQRAADEAEEQAKRQEQTRLKLERQRLKNIRSAQNAIRQREIQQQRYEEFQEELRVAQENRDARNKRFAKARQLVVDELEEEAPLWLTTPEEIEEAFTPEAEQLLWGRPNGVIGAPMPTDDAEYWQYETHTLHMDKTYPTHRELLLEQLLETCYFETNVDKEFWTDARLEERKELEEKAKLRAMVRDEGRRVLLQKQRELLQDNFSTKSKFKLPKVTPVPNVQVLGNTAAMEKEGAEVLLSDPTKFFEFEATVAADTGGSEDAEGNKEHSSYQGPSLGASVGLKDPIRHVYSQNQPYPVVVGKMPRPDLRSEKEKKREAKEKAMLAATQGESDIDKQQADIEFEAEDNFDTSEPLDYDALALECDSDDEDLIGGLDPEKDAILPPQQRYKEEDIDWVIGQIEQKIRNLEEQLRFEVETAEQEQSAKRESERQFHGEDLELEGHIDKDVARSEGTDERGQSYVEYELKDELDSDSKGGK